MSNQRLYVVARSKSKPDALWGILALDKVTVTERAVAEETARQCRERYPNLDCAVCRIVDGRFDFD